MAGPMKVPYLSVIKLIRGHGFEFPFKRLPRRLILLKPEYFFRLQTSQNFSQLLICVQN